MTPPEQIVRRYLALMEARDLEAAQALLAEGFWMEFPGAARMHSLGALIDWARPRYRFVRKTYDHFDTCAAGETAAVYCFGTLAGEWHDGSAFSGIRFIDRFTVRDGRLIDQRVWNDLAEHRAGAPSGG
ncbi:MAG: nuclear transport factor 2 family protein [Burkholderiales bacterium]|nr:nuclear transport factor 2 family protein [Burkholderiales bacterium]